MTCRNRGQRRRRISLFATTSFVAASLLSGGTLFLAVMTPGIVLAAVLTP